MKSRIIAIIAIFYCISICCKRDKSPISPTPTSFVYPINIGNEWNYNRIFFFRYHGDPINITNPSDTSSSTSVIKILRETTLQNSIKTYQFEEILTEQGNSYSNETYYSNHPDGLYMHGYRGPGYCIPKTTTSNKILFKGYAFNNISEMTDFFTQPISFMKSNIDSLIIEDPPILTLAYPPQIGKQWTYRSANKPWRMDKKIIAKETIIVPSGKFDSFKIQYLYDFEDDSKWDDDLCVYDHVSQEGLIKRTAEFRNSTMTNETGEIIGMFDSIEEITLANFKIK